MGTIQFRRKESKSRPGRRTGMKGIDALEEAAALHEALPQRVQQRKLAGVVNPSP